MKVDRKPKAEKSSPAGKGRRRAAPKMNGKHPLAAYEHIPVGIVEASLDGNYMDVNEEFCRILGYSRQELLQLGIKDCTHEDDYAIDSKLYEQLVAGKIPFYRLEKRFVRKIGREIWVELTRTLVCDEKGKPVYTVGVVLDISDRKDVERVLRDSVERLRLATGAAKMFMWEWDFQDQNYILADNFEQVLGFSGGLLPSNKFETIWALSPEEDVQRISEEFDRAIEQQRDLHALPYRVINPENGQVVWLEISAKIIYDNHGKPERMFGVAQNITESKKTQDEIAIISQLPEQNPNPVMRITPDGRILYANNASASLLEAWSRSEEHPIPDPLQQAITDAFASGAKKEVEISYQGSYFACTLAPIREAGYINFYGKDITPRKRAEEALRSSEERMRLAIEASRMVAWEWDPITDRVTTSENIRDVYGLSAVDGAAAGFSLIWPEDLPTHREKVEQVTRQGGEYHSEFRVTRPLDGHVLWMEERATALTDANGQVIRLVGVVTDITERKQAEEKLRESEERFRALVSQATAGIAQSDTESRLTFVNPRFCEMLGCAEEELLGRTIWELTYTDDLEENKRLFRQMITRGEPYQFEKRFIRRDGSTLWTNVSVTGIHDSSGKPKGGVGVMIDIEQRKQAEEALVEFARQQEALYRLSEQLHRADSPDDVYDAALDAILRALQCDRASILLYDNQNVMRFVAWRGLSDDYRQATDGHSPWTPDAIDPQPIHMGDVRTADLDESLRAVIEGEGIGALAFIPLVVNEKLIGKFMIYFNAPHRFDEKELDLSLTIAHQLAFGIKRNRTERALKRERETLERLFETMPVMVSMIDPETNSLRLNAEIERTLGWKNEGMTVLSLLESLYPDAEYRNEVLQRMAAAAGKNEWVEVRVQARDGRTLDSMWSNISIMDGEKLVTGIALGIDITERKQTEKRLLLLAEISDMLRNFEDPHELMYAISKAVGEHLNVKRALFNEIDLEHDLEIVHRDYHNGWPSVSGVHKISEYSSHTTREVAAGKTVINADSKTDPRTAQDYEKTYALSGERAYVVVPMMRDNRWVASLWVSDDMPRTWSSEEISLLETVAERTWTVIEKLRIDAELRESEERLRATLDTTVVGFATLTTDTRFVEVNDAFCNIVGYSREELLGMDSSVLTHPDFIESTNQHVAQLLAGEIPSFVLEKLYIRKDGVQIWVQNSVSLMRGEDGKPLSLIVICQDVTERKSMEEQLRAREAELEDVINQTPFMLTRCTRDLRYRFVSRAYAEMIGRTPEEVENQPLIEIMGEEGLKTILPYVERVLAGERVQYESGVTFQNVGTPFLQVVYMPDRDEQGKVVGWFASIVDISERKRAEERLRQSEERFRQAANASGALVYEVDLVVGTATVVHGMEHLVGYASQETVGSSDWWHSLIHPEDLPTHLAQLETLLNTGGSDVCEYRVKHRNGNWIVVQDNRLIIQDDAGQFLRLVGAVIDITERKRIEEALRIENERFMRFVNSNIVGILITDPTGKVVLANDYYLNLLGLTRQDMVEGKVNWRKFTPPEWLPADEKAIRELRETGVCEPYEKEYMRTDGTRVPVYLADAMLPGPGEEIAAFAIDITERKRAEETLRRNEELFSTLMEAAPFGVYFIDSEFRLRAINKGSEEVFQGIEPLIGRDFAEVLRIVWQEPFATEAIERFRHTLRTGESYISPPSVEKRENIEEIEAYDWQIHRIILPDGSFGVVCYFYDLSEQKRMEAAVRESEQRFRNMADHAPVMVWVTDVNGSCTYLSQSWYEFTGQTPETGLGEGWLGVVHPDDSESSRKIFNAANEKREAFRLEYRLQDRNGEYHWAIDSAQPRFSESGEFLGFIGSVIDITERKRAEEALRESEERFRAILRQATAGIVRKDSQGRLIFVNQAFCNMLGYTEAELLGKTMWDLMHEDDIAENKRSYERLMLEGIPFKLERRLLREDGSVIWVDASVSPIMDSTGKPQSAVAVEVDITGRKKAEEALQQLNLQLEERVLSRTAKLRSVNQALREEITERKKVEDALRKSEAVARENEEKLSTLFALLPVGISFLDPEGQIIQMNPALTNILKLSAEQLLERSYTSRKYIRSDGSPMLPGEFASRRALTEGRTVYNIETGVILEDGEVIWTSVSAAPVDVADVGVVVVTVDITENKRAERALQESRERLQILSQRLVEVQEEERRTIARELHDRVGQTLAALNINLIIISGQLGGKVDEQISTRLSDSMKLVAETISLVRDVMSNLRPAVLDDYGLEAAIDSHLSQYMARYEINTKFEKPASPLPRLGPSIEMTFLRIAQEALMNIAKHAGASQVTLRLQKEANAVHMTIQDNGMGIESWQEANRPGSHGLTIMRERAEAFGGTLRVSSAPGKGTKVEVSIPVENSNPPKGQKEISQ